MKVCDSPHFYLVRSINVQSMKAQHIPLQPVSKHAIDHRSYYVVGSQADNRFYFELSPYTHNSFVATADARERDRGIRIRQAEPTAPSPSLKQLLTTRSSHRSAHVRWESPDAYGGGSELSDAVSDMGLLPRCMHNVTSLSATELLTFYYERV